MAVSATQLRQNIYAILDEALATGKAVEIERKGKRLRIVPEPVEEEMSDEEYAKEFPKLAKLKNHNTLVGSLDDLIDVEWNEDFSDLRKIAAPKRKASRA